MLCIILQLVLVSRTSAAHYYGGVMTFTPKGHNEASFGHHYSEYSTGWLKQNLGLDFYFLDLNCLPLGDLDGDSEPRCAVDDTVAVYQSRQTEYRFGMKAFKFVGLHDEVFISCSVMLCRAGYPATRCLRGCVNGTNASISHHHRKRAAIAETSRHHISQRPLRLKRNSSATDSSMNVNLNSAFIAGVILAAVGMVCGAVIYRKKEPMVKYQSLPSHDF